MALDKKQIETFGDALFDALSNCTTIEPLTEQAPTIEIADAYEISQRFLSRRLAAGEAMIGKKIGVTSAAVMNMLNVHQPDFGFLTDKMVYGTSAEVPASSQMIAPKAEGEIALERLIRHQAPEAWHRLETDLDVREKKVHLTLRLDESVAKFFRAMGPGYQARINRVLATYTQMRIAGFLDIEHRFERMRDESGEAYMARIEEEDGGGGGDERL